MSTQRTSVQASDHRSLGQRLGLYTIDEKIGKGLPLWLPNGTVVRDELEKLAKELEFRAGFQRVSTPHVARTDLYHRSGHLPYFQEGMYPFMEVIEDADSDKAEALVKDEYVLRPMNCPHHHQVYASQPRSYRDLPLRLAEYGQVYRWERSGALSGLARVRGMCMNDGHIYCMRNQVKDELASVLDMYAEVYTLLGIGRCQFRLSRRDRSNHRQKYVDDVSSWNWAENLLTDLLNERNIPYEDGIGHAAFYGPKIDVQVTTSGGTEETLSTVQLDFAQPDRLGLAYVAASGEAETPLCIHRAPFSTHERIVAFLTELYEGAFPTWLAPIQTLVIPVSDRYREYAARVVAKLRMNFVRAEFAQPSETVSRNIRDAIEKKIPNVLIVGRREQESGTVTLRRFRTEEQLNLTLDEFERRLLRTIESRSSSWLATT